MEAIAKRIGQYVYEAQVGGKTIGIITVCRCTERSQKLQVVLINGTILREFDSAKKAAKAAAEYVA